VTEAGVAKVSRRDLPIVIARRGLGATTVSATVIGAARAGISIFATGGIGGVHRGFEQTLDVSADLPELAREDVCVVCAGAKSILDLPRTLELLETLGVPVLGWRTSELPAGASSRSSSSARRRPRPAEAVGRGVVMQKGIGSRRWRHSETGGPREIFAGPPRKIANVLHLNHQTPSPRSDLASDRGQLRPRGSSFDQNNPESILQRLQLLAEGGLRDVASVRRATEILEVSHGDKIFELAKSWHRQGSKRDSLFLSRASYLIEYI